MNRDRLAFALENTRPGQWELFEEFASSFLASEFPELRTTAAPSGDGGRDSELFCPEGRPHVVLQYSVTEDWSTKIRKTARRIRDLGNEASVLVYVTNQELGVKADGLKDELSRRQQLHLDVRDRAYFLDRVASSHQTLEAAGRLARYTVDPILEERGLAKRGTSPLDTTETQAALLYLALEWEDETREKSLTKTGYEGLVRSVLIGTDSENRVPREEVRARVQELLPDRDRTAVEKGVDRALSDLAKKEIRHWQQPDEFCLSYEENTRLADLQAELAAGDRALALELRANLGVGDFGLSAEEEHEVVETTLRLVEHLLFTRGEAFAAAIVREDFDQLAFEGMSQEFIRFIAAHGLPWPPEKLSADQYLNLVAALLGEPGDETRRHLRSLASAYTLLAFLRLAPDVNDVLSKIAGYGEIWLDTSVLLPVFAEAAFDAPGRFTRLLMAAQAAGMELRVTDGVLEEVHTHMDRSLAYLVVPDEEWRGDVPYLIAEYIRSGRALSEFRGWLKEFRGSVRPQQDLADYLGEIVGVERGDLEDLLSSLNDEVRLAIARAWEEVHERRRRGGNDDPHIRLRLARHDIVNYGGVIAKRRSTPASPLGYREWWLTVDGAAFGIRDRVREDLGRDVPDNPVISADFLTNLLLFGPSRKRMTREIEEALPVVVDAGLVEYLTPDIVNAAEKIRAETNEVPPRVKARMVRDHLDRNRWRYGRIAKAGLSQIDLFE